MDGDGNFDGFSAMGFDVLHVFEEVGCDAAAWTVSVLALVAHPNSDQLTHQYRWFRLPSSPMSV